MRKISQVPKRPVTLEEGSFYFLKGKPEDHNAPAWEAVKFVCYTPCPAVVIVTNGSGERIPIAREELFFV